METYCKINNISRQLEQWFANFNISISTFYNIWKTLALLYNPHIDNHETIQDNHDNDCENRQSMVLEGTHVLIYHNKDRLGTGVQLIVAPFLLLYQMSLINEHNIYICPLVLAFYRKTLTLRLFVLILQFNVSAHCQISASKAKFLCTALSACFPWVLSQRISHKHCSYFQVFQCPGESPWRQLLITANQRQLQQKEKYLAHLCRCHSEQSCFCLL